MTKIIDMNNPESVSELKTEVNTVSDEKKFDIKSSIIPEFPAALFLDKHQKLNHLELFKQGWFEIQDANSQKVSYFVSPKPGMIVVDGCAGSGGKTLHLANLMHNKGRIIALDPYIKKLEQLEVRIKRNGLSFF